ncbi:hypothetical protein [Nakamurella aerolata]|uniref:Uncharacterized protein n=1 Tax=Nakamurella aerolata TaxID=1656892 RepID=A0A849A2Y0_9ACTN|nr:hypothetical protein [Nakamurella aerolata]NNG34915.1 hypothetical protein [Nakamurella aerolata]
MNRTIEVPIDIYKRMQAGYVARLADQIIADGGIRRFVIIDDTGGHVFGWLWRTEPSRCMRLLVDLVIELRNHHPQAPQPPIRYSDVVDALRMALPGDIDTASRDAFAADARTYGAAHWPNLDE